MRRIAHTMLWLLVFTIPWQNTLSFESGATISAVIGIAAFVAAVTWSVSAGKIRKPPRGFLWMGAFALNALLSLGWSLDPDATVVRSWTIVQLLAMAWIVMELVNEQEHLRDLMVAYVCGATINIATTFYQFMAGNTNPDIRYSAIGFNPNDQAIVLSLGVPFAWGLLSSSRKPWSTAFHLSFLIAAPVAIVLTGSRTGLLTCSIAFGLSLPGRQPSLRKALLLALAGASCLAALLWVVPDTSWARLATVGEQLNTGDLNLRTTIWSAGVTEFLKYPVLGIGEGAYQVASAHYLGENFVAHNTFVSVLVELGLVGFTIFCAILSHAAVAIARMKGSDRLVWFAVFATWLVGVQAATWETQKVTWLCIACVLAASRTANGVVALRGTRENPAYEICRE